MQELKDSKIKMIAQELMSRHTTLAIGGPAEWYVEVSTLTGLSQAREFARQKKLPAFFLGAGSNLLVCDRGIQAVVIRLRGEFEQALFDQTQVRAGAGTFLPTLVKLAAEKSLGGIEPLVGVPGTIGGALIMNAGTRELEIGKAVHSVEVLSEEGRLRTLEAGEIKFGYRCSSLENSIICFATLQLKAGKKDDIMRSIEFFLSNRLKSQPIGRLNVGSIFKNPVGDFAARLIESCGFKGRKNGKAQVSEKHANFIINSGGATAQEVKQLIFEIQTAVQEKYGVLLEPEIKMVGL